MEQPPLGMEQWGHLHSGEDEPEEEAEEEDDDDSASDDDVVRRHNATAGVGTATGYAPHGDGEAEPWPSELNTLDYGKFLQVSPDKRSVRYTGDGSHNNDVGAIQANWPVPTRQLLYYYEVQVKDHGARGRIGVGFADRTHKLSRQPGWESNSYGYHGDDGKKFHSARGDPFSETFTTGDVIGAGINLAKRELFYTKNGKMLGVAFKEVKLPLYPTVGLHSRGEHVAVNFGQDAPFVFDVAGMAAEERAAMAALATHMHVPSGVAHHLMRDFLLHYGCSGTLRALDAECGPDEEMTEGDGDGDGEGTRGNAGASALETRARIRKLVLAGSIDDAIAAVRDEFPSLWQQSDAGVAFHLHGQKFLELLAAQQAVQAVQYARTHLAPYRRSDDPARTQMLEEWLATLAYEDAATAPAVAHLMGQAHRHVVADVVNAALLRLGQGTQVGPSPAPLCSALERLLRQVAVCHLELRELNGAQGELFHLHKAIALD